MLYAAAVFAGSVGRLDVVWTLSDIWNGLMAFPNLTALLFLSGQVMMPDWRGSGRFENMGKTYHPGGWYVFGTKVLLREES